MDEKKAIYFASDFHLGSIALPDSSVREKKIVRWLDSITEDVEELYLLGDIFDYWFEYKEAIPKGFIRIQGKLAEMADRGIPIHFFTGNHDLWIKDYFTKEIGVKVYHQPQTIERYGHIIHLGHGDGLGPGDIKYKILKRILTDVLCQKGFSLIHPSLGLKMMKYFSHSSRMNDKESTITDPAKERQIIYCENHQLKNPDTDYYIFGHRHIPVEYQLLNGKGKYYNLGEWWDKCSYLRLGEEMELRYFDK